MKIKLNILPCNHIQILNETGNKILEVIDRRNISLASDDEDRPLMRQLKYLWRHRADFGITTLAQFKTFVENKEL